MILFSLLLRFATSLKFKQKKNDRFDNTNTQELMQEMSEEERRKFGFDVGAIDWKDYISNVHIPGLRRHVMKGRGVPTGSQLVATAL